LGCRRLVESDEEFSLFLGKHDVLPAGEVDRRRRVADRKDAEREPIMTAGCYTENPLETAIRGPRDRRGPNFPHPEADMASATDRNPRHHTQKMQALLKEIMDHLRWDVEKVDEPQLKVMFETSAEVVGGLIKAFRDYEQKNESACRR
jgi:hypothetical protein